MFFSPLSASLRPRLFSRPRRTASSSESLRVSSLAGWAVTLPKKGLEAEVGFGDWAWRAVAVAMRARVVKKAGIANRPEAKFRVRVTAIIVSDEKGGERIPQ